MKTVDFDFEAADGDTIITKSEAFFSLLMSLNEEKRILFVIGHSHGIQLFRMFHKVLSLMPMNMHIDCLSPVGNMLAITYRMDFAVFESGKINKNELVLFRECDNVTINLVNF